MAAYLQSIGITSIALVVAYFLLHEVPTAPQLGGAVPLARKLDPGDSCTVQVEYAPTTPGSS